MTILNANADIALNAVSPAATVSDSTIKAPLVNQPPAPISSSKVTLPSSGMTLTPEQLSNNNAYLASHGYGPDGKALPGSAVSSNTTDANRPSSSSSVITNNNTSSTISRTLGTNPTSTGPSKSASDLATSLSSQGINVDSSSIQSYIDNGYTPSEAVQLAIQISGVNDAKKSADAAAAHEQTIYQQTLASQNAQYGQASAKLASDRKNNLDTATAQLASLNSSGGISSDSSQFLSHINAQYDLAQQQLDLQAEQAKAALAAGDTQAYNAIQTNMANTISQVKTNITNLLSGIQSTKTAAAQNATAEQDKAVSAYQSNLVNLPQPQDLAALPATYGSLTSAQKTQLESTTAYQQGIKAGYTPQSILTDIQSAATSAYKKQAADTSASRANTALITAQVNLADKQAALIDANIISANGGQPYLDAIHNAIAAGKYTKDKVASVLSSVSDNIKSGDTANAKKEIVNFALSGGSATDQRMYSTLAGLPGIMSKIKNAITALPKDQQPGLLNGTYQNIAAYFGQNPDPALRTLAAEMGHVQKNYITGVYGMRAASLQGDSIFNNLFPSGTDAASLSFSVAEGLINTAKDTIDSKVQSTIGDDSYEKIFGQGNSTFGTKSSVAPTSFVIGGQTIRIGQQIQYSDGKIGIMGSDGKVTINK